MKSWLITSICLVLVGCITFKKEETILAEHIDSNGDKIRIYFVALGATTQDVIQVRKGRNNEIIANFENYNSLKSSSLLNDSTLQLILTDTGYGTTNKFDTMFVNTKK